VQISAEVAAKYAQFRVAYNRYQSVLIVLYLPILTLLTKLFFYAAAARLASI
jgi:hypothetical protein